METGIRPAEAGGSRSGIVVEDGWAFLVLLGAVVAIASFLIHEVYSLDIWWQIAIGRDIVESVSIPTVDRYATAALGRPYHDSHWLFQVALALVHRVAGITGVQVLGVVLWSAALWLCYRATRRAAGVGVAAVLLLAVAMASVERFLPRPEIVTFACVALFYGLLQGGRFGTGRGLALLALAQLVWTNSHGLFVIGPFMVGCYWVVSAARRLRGPCPEFAPTTRALLAVVAASVAAPFGPAGWRYAALLFVEAGTSAPDVMQSLGELSDTFGPAFRSSPSFWFFAAMLILAAAAVVVASWRRQLTPRTVIVVAMCAAALTGRRNVVLFVLVAAPFAAEVLGPLVGRFLRPGKVAATAVTAAMIAWSWFPLSGAYYVAMEIPARWGVGVTPSFFPAGLPAFLDEIDFRGTVLNSNTLGGFYLYHGYPKRLPLSDGRWEVYDPDVLARLLRDTRSPAGWRSVASDYGVEGILLAHTSPEARAILPSLAGSDDWRPVYYDHAASFWMPAGDPATPAGVDLADPGLLPEPRRPDDGLILHAFLSAVGADELALVNLERTLQFGVRQELLLEQQGLLLLELSRPAAAEPAFEALLRENPDHATALNELAYLAYVRGDLDRAAALMRRLVALQPDNRQYAENLRRVVDAQKNGAR